MNTEIIDAGRDMSGGYKVDVSRGENVDHRARSGVPETRLGLVYIGGVT